MTTALTKLFVFGGPITLVVLIAIAGYAYSQILNLSLPIPQALGLFTVVLPLITGISTQGARGLIQRSRREQYQLTLPLIAVLGFQLIYETIIATLALTNILPPDALRCDLESRWQHLFRAKNGQAIQAIQDKFDCCGLNSVKDRAWPFSSPTSCSTTFPDRHKSCFGEWRQAQQITAGLLLLVALTVFLVKVISLIYLLTSSSWINGSVTRHFKALTGLTDEDTEDNRATMRRLIEQGDNAPYSDEPAENPPNQGPRVQPSALVDTENQWRDENNGHHL